MRKEVLEATPSFKIRVQKTPFSQLHAVFQNPFSKTVDLISLEAKPSILTIIQVLFAID